MQAILKSDAMTEFFTEYTSRCLQSQVYGEEMAEIGADDLNAAFSRGMDECLDKGIVTMDKGERAMFAPDCADGAADNSAAAHVYYVRLPKACADAFPAAKVLADDGENLRILTEKVSVQKMHEGAAALRKAGNAVFFAAAREA